ncbi:MAG: hypothetical protein WBD45_17670, partial [Terriglobales bacterium]
MISETPLNASNAKIPRLPGATRTIKLPLTEIPTNCPHCKAALILATVMDVIKGQRTCPKCRKQFVIENDMPRILDDG